jgi:hypothetical protein
LQEVAVAVTGLDHLDYDDVELLAEVHRIVSEVRELAGSLPRVGSPQWWAAEPIARIAGLLVLAEARLVDDPHQLAAEQLKAVSIATSGGMDWRDLANRHVPHTELQRRREELGPLYQPYTGGPVTWAISGRDTAA